MLEIRWLNELISASVMGYFIDFVEQNRKAKQVAFWLLSMVWLLQTIFLFHQILIEKHFPIGNIYAGMFFYSWILVTLSLAINRWLKLHFFNFFINLLGFFILLLHIVAVAQNKGINQEVQLMNELLIAHITLALTSYGFFTLSFVFAFMYLLQYYLLKEKRGYKWLKRMGDLQRLDHLSRTTITIGVPILLISIILGVVWAYHSGSEFYWYDIKTIGSIVVLLVYIVYLILRAVKGHQSRSVNLYNTAAFLYLLINFLLFNVMSNFHF